ncbi:uncharacterized protein LOC111387306 [Olea europaea var. sylvestris]|uniref:uncharacterized protein LOC111387306 n=1 Tax=Olea europaea var. sylvestris TaxID=158386 RepID=UPI000C1D6B35|nr:uncharacterized protein LOC111387306 [Olea europaea var. sylvestris]
MGDSASFQDQVDTTEEAEETLSLCDFSLNVDEPEKKDFPKIQDRRSSSEPSDFFEFFSDVSSDMSHAEDIIFCGKLVPYKEQPLFKIKDHIHNSLSTDDNSLNSFTTRRCESLSAQNTRSQKTKKLMRNSRSLDYRKLRRNTSLVMKSEDSEIQRSSSKSSTKSDVPGSKLSKPRWYILMFGLVKFPPEMDLQDIKSRQVRRNVPGSMFPAIETGMKAPVSRNERRNSWGHDLLRVLSCKDHGSIAVTAPSDFVPHV